MPTPFKRVSPYWPSAPVLEWTEYPTADLASGLIDTVDFLPAVHQLNASGADLEVYEGFRSVAQFCLSWSVRVGGITWGDTNLPDAALAIRQGEATQNAIHDSIVIPLVLEPSLIRYPGFSTARSQFLQGDVRLNARRFQVQLMIGSTAPDTAPLFTGGVYLRAF